jgi:hypothetical protein
VDSNSDLVRLMSDEKSSKPELFDQWVAYSQPEVVLRRPSRDLIRLLRVRWCFDLLFAKSTLAPMKSETLIRTNVVIATAIGALRRRGLVPGIGSRQAGRIKHVFLSSTNDR